jgi:hypothetical protein
VEWRQAHGRQLVANTRAVQTFVCLANSASDAPGLCCRGRLRF